MSEIVEITWAEQEGKKYIVLFDAENRLEVTPSFGKRINAAQMGSVLSGKDVTGKLWKVRIGKRYF